MDLELDDTQLLLAKSVRDAVGRASSPARLRELEASAEGFDVELWRLAVELGWPALPFPVERGGAGGDLVAPGIVAIELGRAAAPLPLLASTASAIVAERLGLDPAVHDVVGLVASGGRATAVGAPHDGTPLARAERGKINGGPWIVAWADGADVILVPVAEGDGDGDRARARIAALAPAALAVEPAGSTDNERIAIVTAARAEPIATTAAVDRAELDDALAVAGLLGSASLVGTIERALELTVGHVAQREQFGQPLGRFQAVQHLCADMAMNADVARLAVLHALVKAASGRPVRADAAVAAHLAARAAELVVINAAQLHGGLGFMAEYELSFHFRRAKGAQLRDGGERHQLERIAGHLDELRAAGWDRL